MWQFLSKRKSILVLLHVLTSCAHGVDIELHKTKVGPFESRAIWYMQNSNSPTLLILPGAGTSGPRGALSAGVTATGQEEMLIDQLAKPFLKNKWNVLQLGKPGVEHAGSWKGELYDESLVFRTNWSMLLRNAEAAYEWILRRKKLKNKKIYVMGHSQGAQMAIDLAHKKKIQALILLSYSGKNLEDLLKWQLFDRDVEHFIKRDLDNNGDQFISRKEASAWPEFKWLWGSANFVKLAEVVSSIRSNPEKQAIYQNTVTSRFCADGHCGREALDESAAKLDLPLYAFNGELDLQTPVEGIASLKAACKKFNKQNCYLEIVPKLQHGFNLAKSPRRHPLLDMAIGPVHQSFLKQLGQLSKNLIKQ